MISATKILFTSTLLFFSIPIFCFQTDSINSDSLEIRRGVKLMNQGFQISSKSLNDSSTIYFQEAKKIFRKHNKWQLFIHTQDRENYLCKIHVSGDSSIALYKKNILLAEQRLNSDNPYLAYLYWQYGRAYFWIGDVKKTIKVYKEGIDKYYTKIGDHINFSHIFLALSHAYHTKYDLAVSLDYLEKSYVIAKKLGYSGYYDAKYYENKGRLYYELYDYKRSQIAYKKSLSICEKIGNIHGIIEGNFWLGAIEQKWKNYNKALKYFKKGLKIHNQNISKRNGYIYYTGWTYNVGIGNVYTSLKQFEKAKSYFSKTIELFKEIKEENSGWINLNFGNCYRENQQFDSALYHYQIGLTYVIDNYNSKDIYDIPDIEYSNDNARVFQLLEAKGKTFSKKHFSSLGQSKSIDDLLIAHKFNLKTVELVNKILKGYDSEGSKLLWNERRNRIYEQTISNSLELYRITKNEKYNYKAFELAEISKSSVLLSSMKSSRAKYFGDIPEDLLEKEKRFSIELPKLQSELKSEIEKSKNSYTTKAIKIKEKIFDLNRQKEDLIDILEKNYPKYYQFKYNVTQATIADVQQSLDEHTTFIEYFVGTNAIYVFTINKNSYQIKSLPPVDQLAEKVKSLPKFLKEDKINEYSETAYALFQKLVEPINPNRQNLIIIPGGPLWQLNFDILITQKPNRQDYRSFDYLIKDHTVNYAYSAKLLKDDLKLKISDPQKECMAFSYNNPDEVSSGNYIAMRSLRNSVGQDLPGSRKEIAAISNVIDGAFYYGSFANERNFKENAKDYKILHLALHGEINDKDPMNSRLYFTQNKDSLEDNYLYAYELYNIELDAELAVLSACNTGSGKLEKGEGVMSLGRAFTFAGCKSLLLSQWEVADAFTPNIMKNFYENLKEGQTKSEALRAAKLSHLKSADNMTANPFYWAPLVQLGDNTPLSNKNYTSWVMVVVSSIVALLALYGIMRRKNLG